MQNKVRFNFYLIGSSNHFKKVCVSVYFDAKKLKRLHFLLKIPPPNYYQYAVEPVRRYLPGLKTLYA
ncbi:MAG: hypothetical protein EpisKO_03760 [Epibacterium sp.]